MNYECAKESIDESLQLLGLNYLDLVLIHWPTSILEVAGDAGRLDTWKGVEEAKAAGKVKSIGVSNFLVKHLKPMLEKVTDKPVVNQIEIHPLYIDEETIKFCQDNNIALIAYAPLATSEKQLMENEIILKLAKKYGK